jgi:hypothetical protein
MPLVDAFIEDVLAVCRKHNMLDRSRGLARRIHRLQRDFSEMTLIGWSGARRERGHLMLTMSALPRSLNCDGSLVLPVPSRLPEWADQGNDEHEELARHVQSGTLPPARAHRSPGARVEVTVFSTSHGQGRIVGDGEGRNYGLAWAVRVFGKIDVLGSRRRHRCRHRLEDRLQGRRSGVEELAALGLRAGRVPRARAKSKARIYIAYTNLPGQPIDEHALDSFDLAEFATRLPELHVREGGCAALPSRRQPRPARARGASTALPSPVSVEDGLLVQVSTKGLASIGDTALTPERAREAHLEIERLDQLVKEAKSRREKWIDENGPIDLGNGKALRPHAAQGPSQLDGEIAVQAIREIVGESSKEFEAMAVERKTSQAAIKRAAQTLGVPASARRS